MADQPKPAPSNVPYFRKVKALTTLLRAESWLRETIMLGPHVGMMTEGALSEGKAKTALTEALALLNGEKDAELQKWIDAESGALRGPNAEYALATPADPKKKRKGARHAR